MATIGERITVLELELKKSIRQMEQESGLGNGTLSSWKEKVVEYSTDKVEKFLQYYSINRQWWRTGEGEILDKKSKEADKELEPHIKESVYRDLVEGNSDYRLIPKVVLDGEYRIMPKKELEKYERQFDKIDERTKLALDAKNDLIKIKDEIIKERDQLIQSLQSQLANLMSAGGPASNQKAF
jgi:hypothetical protein